MTDEYLAARLLSAGCRVDAAGYEDNTALHRAAERGSVELVSLLIDVADADPALTNAAGNTPLMIACENGYVDVVQVSLSVYHCKSKITHCLSLKFITRIILCNMLLFTSSWPLIPREA